MKHLMEVLLTPKNREKFKSGLRIQNLKANDILYVYEKHIDKWRPFKILYIRDCYAKGMETQVISNEDPKKLHTARYNLGVELKYTKGASLLASTGHSICGQFSWYVEPYGHYAFAIDKEGIEAAKKACPDFIKNTDVQEYKE